ncbi:hypothetical protein [Serratia marcescens]|uniref:hypothetical protein n=1 Tax=Serratia marcescens TaxID=615 RepID=UPI00298D932D|nr:hypothetical protein [Serratia marcescens]WPC45512.1 hypothetical protein Q9K10_16710 [Serratia marcescens]
MVLGLMYGDYYIDGNEKYPEAYRLAKNQHNLNIWTNDAAIIGTNYGKWFYNENNDDDKEIFRFIKKSKQEIAFIVIPMLTSVTSRTFPVSYKKLLAL